LARKKTTAEKAAEVAAATVAALEEQPDADAAPPEDGDLLRALQELDESGTDVRWSVTKMDGPPEQQGFIEKISSAQLDRQRFRDEYGPGKYKVVGNDAAGRYVKSSTIVISSVAYKKAEPVAPPQDGVQAMLAVLKNDREQSANKMLAWVAALTPLLTPIITKWLEGSRNQTVELIGALKGLQELQPKAPSVAEEVDRITGIVGKLRELATDEGSSTGTTGWDILRDVAKGAGPVLEGLALRMNPAAAGRALPAIAAPPALLPSPQPGAPATPSGNGQPPPAPGAANVGLMALAQWLGPVAHDLCRQAARDRDPELYAEVILDNLPEGPTPDELIGFIEREDWFAWLQRLAPPVANYPAWFAQFREAALAMLKAERARKGGTPPPPPGPHVDDEGTSE